MNEQNSMFHPLEQDATLSAQEPTYVPRQPRITRPLNNDPGEQAAQGSTMPPPPWQQPTGPQPGAYGTYDNGYAGATGDATQRASNYEKLNPQLDSSNEKWIYLFIGIVIGVVFSSLFTSTAGGLTPLLIIIIAGILFWAYTGNRSLIEDPPRVFAVEDMAMLDVHNTVGSLYVHRGASKSVTVKVTRRANGRFSHPEDTLLSATQQGNQIVINATSQAGRSGVNVPAYITLDIEVPEYCDLQLRQDVGSIKLDGIEGQLQLKQHIGSIEAQNMTLHKQASLDLSVGSIKFDGKIDPAGTYRSQVHIGSLELQLPASSSLDIHTSINVGSVTNQFGTKSVGPVPRARLDLDSNIGSIDIRQR